MRGATAPRLLLELLCARVLLPGADHDDRRRAGPPRPAREAARRSAAVRRRRPSPAPAPPAQDRPAPPPTGPPRPTRRPSGPSRSPAARARAGARAASPRRASPSPRPEPARQPQPVAEPAAAGALTLVDVRRLWPDIVDATKLRRRVAWMHLTQNCQVVAVDGKTLTLGFANAGARDSFVTGGCDEVVRQAAIDVVGADWQIETIVDPGAKAEGTPTVTKAADRRPRSRPPAPAADRGSPTPAPEPPRAARADPAASAAAREAIQQTRGADQAPGERRPDWAAADADAHPDDLDAEHQGISGAELLAARARRRR